MGRTLPSVPSRIFTRKPSVAARILRVSVAAFSVVTLVAFGSTLYLDWAREVLTAATLPSSAAIAVARPANPPPAPASQVESARSVMPGSPAAAEPVPASGGSSPGVLAPAEMAGAGSTAPISPSAPGELAALEAPAALSLGDAGYYWVEYGVFVSAVPARRLQQALAHEGLASLLVETHTSDQRALLSVRSVALVDYDEASEVAQRAQRALGIGPLVRRSAGEPARAPSVPTSISTSTASARGPERYWVQFGAFSRAALARHVKKVLGESGIATAVSTVRVASGQQLFVVRSVQLPDRASALALGRRGQRAAKVDFLLHLVEPNHAGVMLPSRLATNDRRRDHEII